MIRGLLLTAFTLLLQAQEPERAPIPAAPPLDLPRDDGQHASAPFERWVLRGVVEGPRGGRRYALQVVFARGGAEGPWTGSPTWRSDRWWVAQALLVPTDARRMITEERLAREGLPASASADHLDLQVDGWSLGQVQGPTHLRLRLEEGLVDLELQSAAPAVSLPPAEGRPLHRSLQPLLQAQGHLELRGQLPLAARGRFSLLHEWGAAPTAPWTGWEQAVLHFGDGRTWVLDGARQGNQAFAARAQLLEFDARGRLVKVAHAPALAPRRLWTSPATAARYPVSWQISASNILVGVEALFDAQETRPGRPGALPYYRGCAKLVDGHGDPLGDAFIEFTGFAQAFSGAY